MEDQKIRHVEYILFFLLIVFPLLFIWQGIDLADLGYSAAVYQQVFSNPDFIGGSGIWLTNIIGGIWERLFGNSLGLLGIRLAGVFVTYTMMFITYKILKNYLNRIVLLTGLLMVTVFSHELPWLHYNHLTVLFYLLTAFFLIRGLEENKDYKLFLAGVFLTLSVLIRVSNLTGIALALSIIYWGLAKQQNWGKVCIKLMYFFMGSLVGAVAITTLMQFYGMLDLYLNGLKVIFGSNTGSSIGSISDLFDMSFARPISLSVSHGIIGLLNMLIRDYYYIIRYTVMGLIVLFLLKAAFSWGGKYIGGIIGLLFLTAVTYYSHINSVGLRMYMVFLVVGFLNLLLIINIVKERKKNPDYSNVSLIALIILFITPLGSSCGTYNALFGLWLALPISLGLIMNEAGKYKSGLWLLKPFASRATCGIIIVSFFIYSFSFDYHYTYRDTQDRLAMKYSIDHSLLKGIYTTKYRAQVLQEFIDEVGKYVKPDDYLLAYESIPMVHYLTRTRPYLESPWPALYTPQQMSEAFLHAEKSKRRLPVVVRTIGDPLMWDWPNRSHLQYDQNWYKDDMIILNFLKLNNYKVVWRNDFFEILLPHQVN